MGIERGYFYKKKRIGKKVKSIYAGKADENNKALKDYEATLKDLKSFKSKLEISKNRHATNEADINKLLDNVKQAIDITLEKVGYLQHRGELRKCRKMKKNLSNE